MSIVVIAALCLLGAAGCIVSPLSQGESGEEGGGTPFDVLGGSWSLPCTADSTGSFYTVSWLFGGGRFVRTDSTFGASDCASLPGTAGSLSGTYGIGGPVFTPEGYYCVEVDLSYELLGVRYDIFREAGGVLYFGDTATGSTLTELERPTEIDFTMGYERR